MLIDAIDPAEWEDMLSKRGGRGVAGEFTHLHNIRRAQIEGRAKDFLDGPEKFPKVTAPSKTEFKKALKASAKAIETFLCDGFDEKPKRRGFKRGIFTTLSYFVSHDAHHRGRILLTLKVSGRRVSNDVAYGIWAWDQVERTYQPCNTLPFYMTVARDRLNCRYPCVSK